MRGSSRNCPGLESSAGPDGPCPERSSARRLGTGGYLQGRAGPVPLTHPSQEDGRTRRGAGRKRRPASAVSPLEHEADLTSRTAPKPPRGPNQTCASKGGFAAPSPAGEGADAAWAWKVEAEKQGGAWGWVCARGSAPRSAPHHPFQPRGHFARREWWPRESQGARETLQGMPPTGPDGEVEAKGG